MKTQREATEVSEVPVGKLYTYCLRCGRKLKSEESRLVGMGKTCLKKRMESKHTIRLIKV